MTSSLSDYCIPKINQQVAALRSKAKSAEDFAEICFLGTLVAGGPWDNGQSQEAAVAAWRSSNG